MISVRVIPGYSEELAVRKSNNLSHWSVELGAPIEKSSYGHRINPNETLLPFLPTIRPVGASPEGPAWAP
jgi:hypothetical protein